MQLVIKLHYTARRVLRDEPSNVFLGLEMYFFFFSTLFILTLV